MPLLHELGYAYRKHDFFSPHNLMPYSRREKRALSIYDLDLPERAWNVLASAGIFNVHRLQAMSNKELARLQGCGAKTVADIREALCAQTEGRAPAYEPPYDPTAYSTYTDPWHPDFIGMGLFFDWDRHPRPQGR